MSELTFSTVTPMWGTDVTSTVNDALSKLLFHTSGTASDGVSASFDDFFFADLSAQIKASFDFEYGIDAKLTLATGDVTINEAVVLDEHVSTKAETLNQKSFIDTKVFSQGAASLSSSGTDLAGSRFDADYVAKLTFSVDAPLHVSGGLDIEITPEIEIPIPGVPNIPAVVIFYDFGGTDRTLQLVPETTIGGRTSLIHVSASDANYELDFDVGSIKVEVPGAIEMSTSILAGGPLHSIVVSDTSTPFLSADLDVVSVLATLFEIPDEVMFEAELHETGGPFFIDADYTLVSGKLVGELAIGQKITFEPGALTYSMTSSFGETVTGTLGDRASFATPEGEGTFTVQATYTLAGMLKDVLTLEGNLEFDYKLLDGSLDAGASFDPPVIDDISFRLSDITGDLDFGPLAEGKPTLIKGVIATLYTDEQSITLPVYTTTYTLSYENFYKGTSGNDQFTLTTRQETVDAGAGDDRITGNLLDNHILGGSGQDTLFGLAGADVLNGGSGADRLDGGEGRDTASYDGAAGGVLADLKGIVRNSGDAAGDTYVSIENLEGSAFGDTLWGGDDGNVIAGGGGADVLHGRAGNDTLVGGAGADQLYGEADADVFLYNSAADGGDTIFGYSNGDHIALSLAGFGLSPGAAIGAGVTFVAGKNPAAAGSGPTLLYDTKAGDLLWDDDGAGGHSAVLIAHISGSPVGPSDFLFV